MKPPIDDTRRQLGELGAMSAQCEAAERDILAKAEKRLTEAERRIAALRTEALTGDEDAETEYQHWIEERGRLQQVIARAKQALN